MAKIRVAQIKDLSLDNGVITIGTKTENGATVANTITPLTEIAAATTDNTATSVITGFTVNGNTITPKTKSIADILANYYTITQVDSAITNAINGLDATVANVAALANGTATSDIRVEVVETDGKITSVNVTDTLKSIAHSGAAADVAVATGIAGLDATNVQAALAELAGDIATLNSAQLSAGTGIEISTDNKINAKFNIVIETRTEGEGETASTATYIVIKDGNTVIAEENANAFVKDGFLQSVTKNATTNELVFTWNTDAGVETTTIAISDLCDVYTAKVNDWIQLDGYEFSHKTSGVTAGQYGAGDAASVTTFGGSATINVPSVTVDAAGHVTAAEDKTLTVTIPALPVSIDTAVQTVNGDTYVTASKTGTIVTLATQTHEVATATADADGLATAKDVKDYVESQMIAAQTKHARVKATSQPSNLVSTISTPNAVGTTLDEFEVYQNGLLLDTDEYTYSNYTITLNQNLEAGNVAGDEFTVIYVASVSAQAN